jgi:ABC-type oligopeptide transport system substrate-binding subunit
MRVFARFAGCAVVLAASLLGACASVSESDLYKPDYGVVKFSHFDASVDPDPDAIARGLYMPRSIQFSCFSGCSSHSQLTSSAWAP